MHWCSRFSRTITVTCTLLASIPGVLKEQFAAAESRRTKKKELITQLWHIQSDSREKVEQVEAGDICGIVGPKVHCDGRHVV